MATYGYYYNYIYGYNTATYGLLCIFDNCSVLECLNEQIQSFLGKSSCLHERDKAHPSVLGGGGGCLFSARPAK